MGEVKIKRGERGALQDGADATHDDELHSMFRQRLEDGEKIRSRLHRAAS